jgi:hypothetical protein
MKLGSNNISAVRIGSTIVNKIYLGANQIWSAVSYLLDTYSGAAAAYSLRQLKSGVTNAIEVRRSADDTTQDIGFVDGELDTASLEEFVNCEDVAPADYGSGAAAAYSLRYVSASYTGDVIQVRRSSDNATQDFNPTEITDGTLATFCGAGDGFITTWYDQSGNSNDATQSTASAQPQIVSSGSVILENGKPAAQFDGTDDYMALSSISLTDRFSEYIVNTHTDIGDRKSIGLSQWNGGTDDRVWITRLRDVKYDFYISQDGLTNYSINYSAPTNNTQYLYAYELNLSESQELEHYRNNVLISSTFSSGFSSLYTSSIDIELGSFSGGVTPFEGYLQEVVFYASDQSSNRPKIEANINNYYSIYTNTNNGFVTTWYDQSGNGRDATQTTAANQPQIVSSGSVIEENGKPAVQFDGSDDYFNLTTSIATNVDYTGFQVVKRNATSTISVTLAGVAIGNSYLAWNYNDNNLYFRSARGFISNSLNTTNQTLFTSLNIQTGNMTIFNDGSSVISTSPTVLSGTGDMDAIGRRSSDYGIGTTQEIIFYPSDQSSNRSGIETNINDFYSIY